MVSVVEEIVDGIGVVAEEPQSQPVVVAVLHDSQVRRRSDDEAGSFRQTSGAERLSESNAGVACIAEQGHARAAGSGWR